MRRLFGYVLAGEAPTQHQQRPIFRALAGAVLGEGAHLRQPAEAPDGHRMRPRLPSPSITAFDFRRFDRHFDIALNEGPGHV